MMMYSSTLLATYDCAKPNNSWTRVTSSSALRRGFLASSPFSFIFFYFCLLFRRDDREFYKDKLNPVFIQLCYSEYQLYLSVKQCLFVTRETHNLHNAREESW